MKTEKSTQKESSKQSNTKPKRKAPDNKTEEIGQSVVFGIFLAGGLVLALLGSLIGGDVYAVLNRSIYGIFEILQILFCLIAAGLAGKTLYERWSLEDGKAAQAGKDKNLEKYLYGILALAIFIILEELKWGGALTGNPPWSVNDTVQMTFQSIPEKASLYNIAIIAIMRLGVIFAVLYGVGAALYFAKNIQDIIKANVENIALRYAGVFAGLMLITFLMDLGALPFGFTFEEALESSAALALVFVGDRLRQAQEV